MFLGQVTCRGSEQYLNECIPDIMPLAGGGCRRATIISCRKSRSSDIIMPGSLKLMLSKLKSLVFDHVSIRSYLTYST